MAEILPEDREKAEKGARIRETMSTPGWQDIQEYLLEENRKFQHLMMETRIPNPYNSDPLFIPNDSREIGRIAGIAYQIKRVLLTFSRIGRKVSATEDLRQFLRGQYSVTTYFSEEFPGQVNVATRIEQSAAEEEEE